MTDEEEIYPDAAAAFEGELPEDRMRQDLETTAAANEVKRRNSVSNARRQSAMLSALLLARTSSDDDDVAEEDFRAILMRMDEDKHLAGVTNIKEAFDAFDLNADDVIDKREQILMYKQITAALEEELRIMGSIGAYDEATRFRQQLVHLRKEFEMLQRKYERQRQAKERKLFQKAGTLMVRQAETKWSNEVALVEGDCQDREKDLRATHEWEVLELEREIRRQPPPRIKFSKELLELKSAEANLTQLKRFEEAKNVRKKINRVEPVETQRFIAAVAMRNERRRVGLRERQRVERQRLQEKVHDRRLQAQRHREKNITLAGRRVSTQNHCMQHAHVLDSHAKPDFSVRPVVKRRANHDNTSASNRGQQFLDTVNGKKEGEQVYVASLCDLHDFDTRTQLSGTITHAEIAPISY